MRAIALKAYSSLKDKSFRRVLCLGDLNNRHFGKAETITKLP